MSFIRFIFTQVGRSRTTGIPQYYDWFLIYDRVSLHYYLCMLRSTQIDNVTACIDCIDNISCHLHDSLKQQLMGKSIRTKRYDYL